MVSKLLPYQKRLIAEKRELSTRAGRLWLFMGTPEYRELDGAERARLRAQHHIMLAYSAILLDRIEAFRGQ